MAKLALELLAQGRSGGFESLGIGGHVLADQGFIGRGKNSFTAPARLIVQPSQALLIPSIQPVVDGQP